MTDQTAQMPRLIWVIIGSTGNFTGFVMFWLNNDENMESDALNKTLFCNFFKTFHPGHTTESLKTYESHTTNKQN